MCSGKRGIECNLKSVAGTAFYADTSFLSGKYETYSENSEK